MECAPLRSAHIQRKEYFKFRVCRALRSATNAFSREGSWRKTAFAAPLSAKARRCGRARSPERADFPRPGEDVTAGDKKGNLSRSD